MLGQQLYALQLRIKRDKVNAVRKKAEIVGLRDSFNEEIQKYIISLYNASSQVLEFIIKEYNEVETTKPINQAKIDKSSRKTRELGRIRDTLEIYLNDHMVDGKLPKETYLLVLSLFNFCWSEESTDAFISKLITLPKEQQKLISVCLVPNPMLQAFFGSALKEVFDNFEYYSVEKLTEMTLESLKKYAPLMPQFMNKIIDESKEIFCSLLIPYVTYFSIFGIAHQEITIFYPNKKEMLIASLENYFDSDKSNTFFEEITRYFPVYVAPQEANISLIDPKYVQYTLITPEFYPIDEPTFVPLSAAYFPSSMMGVRGKCFNYTVRELLAKCELICLEDKLKTPYQAFANLVSLTSYYGDPFLDKALDEIDLFLKQHPTYTIESICKTINAELDREENSNDKNPLLSIAEYSKQSAFIKKNIEHVNSLPTNASLYLNFISIQERIDQFSDDIAGKTFVEAFSFLREKLEIWSYQQLRNLFSILLKKVKYLDKNSYDKENEELHKFLEENKESLVEMHKQDFLQVYKNDPSLLKLFFVEFELAFKTRIPIARMEHIHNSYTILIGLLKEQGIGDIGADQIVPLAMLATVLSNPIGLAETQIIFKEILQPLINSASPIDSAEEYSLIQFLSTLQYIIEQKTT